MKTALNLLIPLVCVIAFAYLVADLYEAGHAATASISAALDPKP